MDPIKDVKTDPQVPDPNQPSPEGVKPPEVQPAAPGVKPPEQPAQEPGVKTDPALLLKSLQDERDKRRAAEARVDQMKGMVGDKMQWDANGNPIAPVQTQQQPQQDIRKQIDEAWETDPKRAVQMEMAMGFQWFDNVNTTLDAQRSQVRTKYPDFNKYEVSAMNYVRTLPLDQRSKDGIVELAYLVQKGQDSGSIYQTAQEEIIKKLQSGESVQGLSATHSQSNQPAGKQLTADQIKVAEAMGMPASEYMKGMK